MLPLLGVIMSETKFTMVSKWMPNGNINEFVRSRSNANRFELVSSLFIFASSLLLVDDHVISIAGGGH